MENKFLSQRPEKIQENRAENTLVRILLGKLTS